MRCRLWLAPNPPPAAVSPESYDAWYRTPRGAWIGETEYRLLRKLLQPEPGASVLDVGCGTGYFSRRFALDDHALTGVDLDAPTVAYARNHAVAGEQYAIADASALPFADGAFDYAVSIAALCFVADERRALREMLRVARRGIALGLLNRRSLLHWQKGRRGGSGAYRGARWHTRGELKKLLVGLPLEPVVIGSAIALPSASSLARAMEGLLPCGAFLAVAARKSGA